MLPNFLVGGALKGGTTTLYHYLKQHPDVFMAARKELRFFAYDVDDPWCLENGHAFPIKNLEAYKAEFSDVGEETAVGEASPNYLASSFAPQKIRETIPDVKLIFSLRDPVKSAYSSYLMDVRGNREDRPIEDALDVQERRVERYRYYHYLQNWYATFPADQIKVILFENLIARTDATMREIYAFLHVDPAFTPNKEEADQNKGGIPKSRAAASFYRTIRQLRGSQFVMRIRPYLPKAAQTAYRNARDATLSKAPPMPEHLIQNLQAYYAEDIKALAHLTELDLSPWQYNRA